MTDCMTCPHTRADHDARGCTRCDCDATRWHLLIAGVREGERRRDAGMEHLAQSDAVTDWRDRAYAWIDGQPQGSRFTSTDLVDEIGMPPRPNAVGAVIRARSVSGAIRHSGQYIKSARPTCHAAVVAVWIRTEPDATAASF